MSTSDKTPFIYDQNNVKLLPILLILLILTMPLIFWSDLVDDMVYRSNLEWFVLFIYALCLGSFLLEKHSRELAHWVFLTGLSGMILAGAIFLHLSALLSLLFVPVGLACFYFGMRPAFYFGVSIAVVTIVGAVILQANLTDALIAVFAIAVAYAMLYFLVRPVREIHTWVDDYYKKGLAYWTDARDNQQNLQQTLGELTHANEQLRRLNALAQNLRQEAEDARRTKEEFVANVSHELRSPLNMIIGFSEHIVTNPLAYGSKIPPTLLADLSVIYRNAAHLSGLIDDILDLSQIEMQQMALSRSWVDLDEIVADTLIVMKPLFTGKGLYLETNLDPLLPDVYCDPLRIREVLVNLLSNAGRFTEQGGVTVFIHKEEKQILFQVCDTGPGIKDSDLPRLFQPFQQLDTSIRRRYGGTGLGLNISKNFIIMHGGKIWVESKEDVGTSFFFTLPDFTEEQTEESFSRWLSPEWEYHQRITQSAHPVTIVRPRFLVLEKGTILRRLLCRYYDIGTYVNVSSLEAVWQEMETNPARALYINEESVAASLSLCNLPDALPKGLPVIICSIPEKVDALEIYEGLELLTKPISKEKLLAVLDRLGVQNGTVLVVDDQVDALQFYNRIFSSLGGKYSVVQATDGEEAIGLLGEYPPNLIVLDLIMPGMDGFQFLEHLNREGLLKDQKIVVISAFDLSVQPVLIDAMGFTRGGGLSLAQFLECVKALSRVLELPD
jgi:signal transduction histidine kinase/CheY-like chemotaxis protein